MSMSCNMVNSTQPTVSGGAICAGLHYNSNHAYLLMFVHPPVLNGQDQDVHEEAGGPTCLSILLSSIAKTGMFIKNLVTLPVYPSSCP